MANKPIQSAERVSPSDMSDNYVYQRSILAYHRAAELVSGDVLEIGTGSGYGVAVISPKASSFLTIDKYECGIDLQDHPHTEFRCMSVPPLTGIPSNSFDYVITFQVIEHIKNDFAFLKEIHRVLRPGGRLIVSTPNKKMSLTRNPWHVREYTPDEFKNLIGNYFQSIVADGVYGDDKVMRYYEENRRSVERFKRLDILHLEQWLPRWMLKIPYDMLNRINRRKLLVDNRKLTSTITMDDYYFKEADDTCFDLYFIAEKE
ncbi:MAG: class I SAM-dependent methyltransferase [Rikenellaceae bacterium]|nr:class I SAM-dependent methyltransferase [Rikenellaceae bacterium]